MSFSEIVSESKYWFLEKVHEIEDLPLKVALVVCVLLFFTFIASNLHAETQIPLAYSMLFCMFCYAKFVKKKRQVLQNILVFYGLYLSLRYMHWRFTVSVTYSGFFDFIGTMMLVLAEIYSINIYVLGIFSSFMPLQRKVIDVTKWKHEDLPTVDVFIPTYSEPIEMVVNTAMAAGDMNYPKDRFNVHICDDGGTDQKCNDSNPQKAAAAKERRETFMDLAEKIGVIYLTRPKNLHAKAGNLNEAFQKTKGDLVLILDCDHIPTKNFLRNTVGWFPVDPKVFLVQTPHCFYNPDPIERNLKIFRMVPSENQMFYQHIQRGHDFWDSSFFCGSAAVLRRAHLDLVGGIAGETITEDAETAVGLHAMGYRSAYIDVPMVRGRNPDTFAGLVLQRIRWTQGMIQIFLLKNPFRIKGLKWYQRLSYTSASSFWFFAFSRVTFLISPLLYLFFGLKIYRADGMDLLAFTIPHVLAANSVSGILYAKVRWSLFSEVYETACSVFTLPALIEVLIRPRGLQFEVTPKGEDITKDFVSHLVYPFLFLFMLVILGFVAAIYRWFVYPEEHHIILMTSAWNALNLFLSLTGLAVCSEKGELRVSERMPSSERCAIKMNGVVLKGQIQDLSEGGVAAKLDKKYSKEEMMRMAGSGGAEFVIFEESGEKFSLNAQILRMRGDMIMLKFLDLEEDLLTRRRLIGVLYGSESKWIEMDKRDASPSIFLVFWFILKHTLKYADMKGIFVMARQDLIARLKGQKTD